MAPDSEKEPIDELDRELAEQLKDPVEGSKKAALEELKLR